MDIKPRKPHDLPGVTRRQTRHTIGVSAAEQSDNRRSVGATTQSTQTGIHSSSAEPQPFVLDVTDIDNNQETATGAVKRRWSLRRLFHRNKKGAPRRFKRARLAFVALLLIGIGFVGMKAFWTVQGIIDRNSGGALALMDDVNPSQLNGEGDGRVNILLIGIGGDQHEGGDLADTIMVMSIDPFNYDVAMLSVPRDLWVDIPGQWTTKINAAHALGEESGFAEEGLPDGGPGLLQKTVQETLGIPIHYYARVDFNGFIKAVDAVGNITVDVPETICDYTIAWQFGFSCIEAGQQNFDSNEALFYARTRASARGDLDRGERQRLILLGLRDKILSVGTFANPVKVLELMSAAGGHVKTNISSTGDIKRLYEITEKVSPDKIISAGLDDFVTTGNVNGASAVLAKDPTFVEIQRYVRSIFTDGFIKKEAAQIDILNGSGIAGQASATYDELDSYGYVLGQIGDAPTTNYTETVLYDLSGGTAPFTKQLLEKRLGVTSKEASQLPNGITTEAKFVIIVGTADAES